MANDEDVARLQQGIAPWNDWRAHNRKRRVDLRESKLAMADLTEADLSGADLREADLSKASLAKAELSGGDLSVPRRGVPPGRKPQRG